MASNASDDKRVSQVTCYDRYGFAVYDTSSEFAVDDCRTHEYRWDRGHFSRYCSAFNVGL